MLTLIGLVILNGLVVNNAISMLHQMRYRARECNMPPEEAIDTATHNRIRPVFRSALAGVFGMLPQVFSPLPAPSCIAASALWWLLA
ncbi:MAG: multidrug efflux pump subunit AcrB [Gammaproteobacteria bacterium]|jgi:multidrug efflux pump subunit AcrB